MPLTTPSPTSPVGEVGGEVEAAGAVLRKALAEVDVDADEVVDGVVDGLQRATRSGDGRRQVEAVVARLALHSGQDDGPDDDDANTDEARATLFSPAVAALSFSCSASCRLPTER